MDTNEKDHNISDTDEELDAIESEPCDSPCGETKTKNSEPIILNAQITKNYFKSMYGDDSPTEISSRNSTSWHAGNTKPPFLGSPVKIVTSPSKTPDVINSKVCPPIRSSNDDIAAKKRSDDQEEKENDMKSDEDIEEVEDAGNEQEVSNGIEKDSFSDKEIQQTQKNDGINDTVDDNKKTILECKSITKTIMEEKSNFPPKSTLTVSQRVVESNSEDEDVGENVKKEDEKIPMVNPNENKGDDVGENSESVENFGDENREDAKEEEIKIVLCDDNGDKSSEVMETSTPQPLKKKRGRPRKTPLPGDGGTPASAKSLNDTKKAATDNDGSIDTPNEPKVRRRRTKKVFYEYVEESDSEPEATETTKDEKNKESGATPSPRKRGRPRKQPVDPEKLIEEETKQTLEKPDVLLDNSTANSDNNDPLSASKRGRKRKKIDYFAMENSYFDIDKHTNIKNTNNKKVDDEANNHSSEESFDEESTAAAAAKVTTSTGKRRGRKRKQIDKPLKDPLSNEEEENDEADCKEKKEDEFRLSVKNKQTMRTYTRTPIKIQKDVSGEENASTKSASKRPRTGKISEMLRNVFSAAIQKNNDTSVDEGDTTAEGKADKDDDDDSTIHHDGDDDDMDQVKCVECQKKMHRNDWDEHNLIEHYNLSWIDGETPLTLDDNTVRRRLLKVAISKLSQLKCPKCSTSETIIAFKTPNEYMQHTDECFGIVSQGKVLCGVCSKYVEEQKWLYHKLKVHNNLAWRVGDRPLDLSNQAYVFFILNGLYKHRKPLYCYKCDVSKKSVLGFLSHQAQCGIDVENAKVECHLCSRKVLPVSMPTHMRLVHEKKNNDQIKFEKHEDSGIVQGERKRKAAQKALIVINSITKEVLAPELKKHYIKQTKFEVENSYREIVEKELQSKQIIKCKFTMCDYNDEHIDTYLEHMKMCQFKPKEFYLCKHCLLVTNTQKEIEEHVIFYVKAAKVENEYKIKDDYDEDDDSINEEDEEENDETLLQARKNLIKKRQNDEKRSQADPNFKAIPTFLSGIYKKKHSLFSCAFEYTLEFCNQHFTQSDIFTSLNYKINDWILIDQNEAIKYLPQIEESCEVARISTKDYVANSNNKSLSFRKFELFEVEQIGDFTTIFCGGPVHTLAWLPTPYIYLKCNQLLAVAVGSSFDGMYKVHFNYNEPTSIQFWNFGILKNKTPIPKPTLMFCLAVDIGPIWHLEWCPSGCYSEKQTKDDEMKRLGLLAVAGSTPLVHIYAVPWLEEEQMELVYKVKPILKLQLCTDSTETKSKYFPTKIAWSKASGHQQIAVGYTNGMVGLFDVKTKSKLSKYKDKDSVDVLLPYKIIKAHRYYITVLSMVHLQGGSRWLLTGSFDRHLKTWDLSNDTSISCNRLRVILDGLWMTNWMTAISGADTLGSNSRTLSSRISSHRDYLFQSGPVLASNTAVVTVSVSDWLNGIIQGNVAGDVVAMFPHQLLYCPDIDKYSKYKYALSYTRLMKNDDNKGDAKYLDSDLTTYENTIQRYRLLFCDMETNLFSSETAAIRKKMLNNEDLHDPTISVGAFNIRQVNKLSFNPNCQASLYFAAGYQVGFVRLTYLRSLDNDKQVV